jgi:hypothetical protein
VDPDPDPGGPKTCGSGGSGSATLLKTIYIKIREFIFFKEGRKENNYNKKRKMPHKPL